MNREDWNKFRKVFKLDVDVTVEKDVTRSDVILSLLNEGEIAYKGKDGSMHLMEANKETIELLIIKNLEKEQKTEKKK